MRHCLWDRKHDAKKMILKVLRSGSLWLHFLVLDGLPYVSIGRYGRLAVFVWLCKLHTIEGRVLCRAKVVSSKNLLKAVESRRLHGIVYCRVCSMYAPSTVPTTHREGLLRLGSLPCVHLVTTLAWYGTWSSIVSGLHNHSNTARRPQRAMQTVLRNRLPTASNLYRGGDCCTTHVAKDLHMCSLLLRASPERLPND